jgi:hypothetical protein
MEVLWKNQIENGSSLEKPDTPVGQTGPSGFHRENLGAIHCLKML